MEPTGEYLIDSICVHVENIHVGNIRVAAKEKDNARLSGVDPITKILDIMYASLLDDKYDVRLDEQLNYVNKKISMPAILDSLSNGKMTFLLGTKSVGMVINLAHVVGYTERDVLNKKVINHMIEKNHNDSDFIVEMITGIMQWHVFSTEEEFDYYLDMLKPQKHCLVKYSFKYVLSVMVRLLPIQTIIKRAGKMHKFGINMESYCIGCSFQCKDTGKIMKLVEFFEKIYGKGLRDLVRPEDMLFTSIYGSYGRGKNLFVMLDFLDKKSYFMDADQARRHFKYHTQICLTNKTLKKQLKEMSDICRTRKDKQIIDAFLFIRYCYFRKPAK